MVQNLAELFSHSTARRSLACTICMQLTTRLDSHKLLTIHSTALNDTLATPLESRIKNNACSAHVHSCVNAQTEQKVHNAPDAVPGMTPPMHRRHRPHHTSKQPVRTIGYGQAGPWSSHHQPLKSLQTDKEHKKELQELLRRSSE